MTRARTLSKLGSSPAELSNGAVIAGITTIDASGLNITGVITATTFKPSGTLSITDSTASTSSSTGALIVSGGVGIAKSLYIGEGVSVGGTITYADVTNVDSIGIVTAGKGLRATTGGLIVTAGVSTFTEDVKIGTAATTAVFDISTGKVGIGTTNPLVKFEVYGNGPSASIHSKGANSYSTLQLLNNSGFYTYLWKNGSGVSSYGGAHGTVFANYNGPLVFAANTSGNNAYAERMQITSNGGLLLSNGILVEHCKIVSTAWSTTNDISLDDGNVFLNTANLGGTGTTIDITSTNGLNVDLAVGDMTSVTCITAVNATTAFINHITIAAAAVTESWVGGSAPTDGGGSGYDVYTFNIIKTAANTYVCIANQVKGS